MSVVSDSTPLISLTLIGQLELLYKLLGEVWIPRAVYAEVVEQGGYRAGATEIANADWIRVETTADLR